jgi:4-hydroxy-2-oxoheptanedioate aldolase
MSPMTSPPPVRTDRIAAFREAFTAQRVTYGAECSIPSTFTMEIMGYIGFDWLFVDLEHSAISIHDLVPMLQITSISRTPVIVRVPWLEPGIIMRVLDAGAVGVVVPMVNSAEDARAAVAAVQYPPRGIRSWGPFRTPDGPGFRQRRSGASMNQPGKYQDGLCLIQIESVTAVEHVEEIVSTPGVAGVFVGVMDLALSAGLPMVHPQEDAAHLARIDRVVEACGKYGVLPAIHTFDDPTRWREAGFKLIMVGSDEHGLVATATAALARARASARASEGVDA